MDKIKNAAIIILGVGEKCAADILKNMSPTEVKAIIEAINQINAVSEEDVMHALNEFFIDSKVGVGIDVSAKDQVKETIFSLIGNGTIDSIIDESDAKNHKWIEALKMQPAAAILDVLMDEHPQIIAMSLIVIFNKVSSQKGKSIIMGLPKELQTDIFRRMTIMSPVSLYAIETLSNYFTAEFSDSNATQLIRIDGIEAVANIISQVDSDTENTILNQFSDDSHLREKIEDKIFPFHRLADIDKKSLQILIAEVKNEDLMLALKGVDERVRQLFMKNMSAKSAEIFKDEMQTLGPVKLSRVLDAQKNIVKIAKALVAEEKILLSTKNDPNIVF